MEEARDKVQVRALDISPKANTFQFNDHRIVSICVEGHICFLATQVAEALGYKRTHQLGQNIKGRHAGEYEEGIDFFLLGGENLRKTREVLAISASTSPLNPSAPHAYVLTESGVHLACLLSKTSKATLFRRWVVRDVLAAISRDGYYSLSDSNPNPLQLEARRVELGEQKITSRNLDAAFAIQAISLDEYRAGRRELVRQQMPSLGLTFTLPRQNLIPGVV